MWNYLFQFHHGEYFALLKGVVTGLLQQGKHETQGALVAICFLQFLHSKFCQENFIDTSKDLRPPSSRIGASYIRYPVRLFIASMGAYDPLLESDTVPLGESNGTTAVDDDEEARLVLGQAAWSDRGIQSSGDYLGRLFEDQTYGLSITRSVSARYQIVSHLR